MVSAGGGPRGVNIFPLFPDTSTIFLAYNIQSKLLLANYSLFIYLYGSICKPFYWLWCQLFNYYMSSFCFRLIQCDQKKLWQVISLWFNKFVRKIDFLNKIPFPNYGWFWYLHFISLVNFSIWLRCWVSKIIYFLHLIT